MKTKRIFFAVILLVLMNSMILTSIGNQFEMLPAQEREPDLQSSSAIVTESHYSLQQTSTYLLPQYKPHEPITINNNADFVTLGFPGDGSPSNPFIIENLTITSNHTLISINRTTVYFYIRNNILNGSSRSNPGIILTNVAHGMINANIITNCYVGISISQSHKNTITNNTLSHNHEGIFLTDYYVTGNNTITHNIIVNNKDGIVLSSARKITVTHNYVSNNNETGIRVESARVDITLLYNAIINNTQGIYIAGSVYSNIAHNIVANNTGYGIFLISPLYIKYRLCEPNTIILNDFRGNNLGGNSQAYDDATCNVFAGNYWDDGALVDQNEDGIGDTPYPIGQNRDPFPLMASAKFPPHILFSPIIIYPNGVTMMSFPQTFKGTVIIQWFPAQDSWNHSITYTLSYSADDGHSWILLASEVTQTSYEWDITTLLDGSTYLVQVVATCLDGLTTKDRSDASFIIQNGITKSSYISGFQGVSVLLTILSLFCLRKRHRRK